MTSDRWILKLGAMGLALALIGGAANAQTPQAEPKATPKAETKAPAQKKAKAPEKAKAPAKKKAASACKGLEEKACGAHTGCSWIRATKTKAGVERKAYCRLKSAPPKKAAAPAKK